MRELRIFVIVAFVIGVIYWGVEPLAHSAMHPKTTNPDYEYRDLDKFGKIDFQNGNVELGKEVFQNSCAGCHGLESQGFEAPMDNKTAGASFGVVPPDLSYVGYTLNHNFLAHFIKDPVRAFALESKFVVDCSYVSDPDLCNSRNNNKADFPMPAASGLGLSDDDIANVVAFLISVAPNSMSDKDVFINTCNRCHSVAYDKGQYDNIFDPSKESKYGPFLASQTDVADVSRYLGNNPPDLSITIRAKGKEALATFINNPQNVPLISIENSIKDFYLNAKKKEEKEKLASLPDDQKKEQYKLIDLKTYSDYDIKLPPNDLRDPWQDKDDYTNLAKQLGVMPFGKSMPRIGLSHQAEEQVIGYLEQVGDSKKSQRETVGYYAIIFAIILSVLAYIWKLKVWRKLH